jgi:hypothetical protein
VNRFFETPAPLRYLGMKVENQNLVQEEIKKRLKSEMCKNINIRIYNTRL